MGRPVGERVQPEQPLGRSRGNKVRLLSLSDFGFLITAAGDSAREQRVQASAEPDRHFQGLQAVWLCVIAGCVGPGRSKMF